MKRTILKIKHYFKSKKVVLSLILFFTMILSGLCISVVSAYYNSSSTFSFLGTIIGDFASGDGDINVIVYVEGDSGRYNLIKSIPSYGYVLNTEKTSCDVDYTIVGSQIVLNTTTKTVCKFYYDKEMDPDIKAFVMLENDAGSYDYNGKSYLLSNTIPAYGYSYLEYKCDDEEANTTLTYNASTREITVSTTEQNVCYVYFENVINTNLVVNVYIEQEDSEAYLNVQTIPGHKEYVKSTTKTSYCEDSNGNSIDATITYENGELVVDSDSVGVCYVYLDLK
ncbi:MAG: hypothetical protein IJN13_00660 [Bacilli bacterium]|nr:hypothetical protein [Bacilli bacterium]